MTDPTNAALVLPFKDNGQDVQEHVYFPNGYGISIIRNRGSYGGSRGLFEVAGLYDGELIDCEGVLPDTVKGWLDIPGVLAIMKQISDLPAFIGAPQEQAKPALDL